MTTLTAVLVAIQALGAVIGAGYAVWAEIAYFRAARDGVIDTAERAHLRNIAHGLRWGMSLLLLASLGLVISAYTSQVVPAPALQSAYWIQTALAFLIILLSWLLSKKRIAFALGSAGIFSAWWFLALLALGQVPAIALGSAVALYILATALLLALFWYIRFRAFPQN